MCVARTSTRAFGGVRLGLGAEASQPNGVVNSATPILVNARGFRRQRSAPMHKFGSLDQNAERMSNSGPHRRRNRKNPRARHHSQVQKAPELMPSIAPASTKNDEK